jgi:bacterial/archaeal transporter family protein
MEWILFALGAAIIFAITNIVDKIYLSKLKLKPHTLSFIMALMAVVPLIIIPIFVPIDFVTPWIYVAVFVGLIRLGVSLFYSKTINSDETSRAAPLIETNPIFVVIFAFLFLGENLSIQNYLGIFAIVVGAIILSIKSIRKFNFRSCTKYALVCAILYAIEIIFVKYLSQYMNFWSVYFWIIFGLLIFSPLLLLKRGIFSNFKSFLTNKKRFVGTYIVNDMLGSLGVVLSFGAIAMSSASLGSALLGTRPLFILILATAITLFFPNILKEDIGKKNLLMKAVGIFLIILGTVFVV